jgi:hypothetical protein
MTKLRDENGATTLTNNSHAMTVDEKVIGQHVETSNDTPAVIIEGVHNDAEFMVSLHNAS